MAIRGGHCPDLERAIIPDPLVVADSLPAPSALALLAAAAADAGPHAAERAACAVVVREGRPVGVLPASAALAALAAGPGASPAATAGALAEPAICARCAELGDPRGAARLLRERGARHLVTLDDDGGVAGLISAATLLAALDDEPPSVGGRPLTEQLLVETERLQLALRSNIQGLYDLDLRSGEASVSPSYATMLGYDPASFHESRAAWLERLHPDDRERAREVYRAFTAGETPEYRVEFRQRTGDGGWKWILSLGQIVERDHDGSPLRMIGTHTDISLRKAAEQELLRLNQDLERRVAERTAALERSEARLRSLATHLVAAQRIAALGSWEFEVGSGAVTWSDQVYRIFGRDPERGPPSFDEVEASYHPDDREQHRAVVEQALVDARPYTLELRLIRPDGEPRHIQARGEPVLDASGALARLVGTVLDITERRQSEEERRNLADRLTLAVRSAAIGIWEWDVGADRLTWDQRMFELYGVDPGAFSSAYDAWASGLHPEDRAAGERAIARALRGEQEFDTEFRVLHPGGAVRVIKAYGLVQRDAGGAPLRMIGVNFDITERKQAEARLREAGAQLLAANHELEAFAYSVSHDLRAPLRAIDGFSQALVEDYAEQLNPEARDYLARVRGGVQRMGMLIDDLLRLSRVSRSDMRPVKVDLSRQARQIAAELQAREPDRQVEWAIEPEVRVWADASLMRVAMENLLANAWKFTGRHERARIEFGAQEAEGATAFFVRDDGAGFNPAYTAKLFGVFQRLHDSHEFPGTGIGLATVQRVIARHGGQVWAEGAVERGATFFFTLPEGRL